jgi:hypothetical protein
MSETFGNEWLKEALKLGHHPRVDLRKIYILDYVAEANEEIIRDISAFSGTKVFVPCVDQGQFGSYRTPILQTVKRALCFADLVILVPAPLWISCDTRILPSYPEFNIGGSYGRGFGSSGCHSAFLVDKSVFALFYSEPSLVTTGTVTFLPVLGELMYRWSHPLLKLPELPRPYSGHAGPYSDLDIHMEAMFNLCLERMVANRLGAAYLNRVSFKNPVINDLELLRSKEGWTHPLFRIDLPDLDVLPLEEILKLRREMPEAFSEFSRMIFRDLNIGGNTDEQEEMKIKALNDRLQNIANSIHEQIMRFRERRSSLARRAAIKTLTFLFATGGLLGDFSAPVSFLTGGGTLWDLVDLISTYRNQRLSIREDSFFFAAELFRHAELKRVERGTMIL